MMKVTVNNIYIIIYISKSYSTQNRPLTVFKEHKTINFLNKKKGRAELDFIHGELIVWFWFAIGGSHVIDRFVPPSHL